MRHRAMGAQKNLLAIAPVLDVRLEKLLPAFWHRCWWKALLEQLLCALDASL